MANPTAVNAGDDVLAAWGNNVLTRMVPIFDTAATRDSLMTAPDEGRVCYVADLDELQLYRGSWLPVHHDFLFRGRSLVVASKLGTNNADHTGIVFESDVPGNGAAILGHRGANSGEMGLNLYVYQATAKFLALQLAPDQKVTIPKTLIIGNPYGSDQPGLQIDVTGTRSDIYWTGAPAGSGTGGVALADKGNGKWQVYRTAASSRRYKQDLAVLAGNLTSDRLLSVPVKQAIYADGYLASEDPRVGARFPTIVAEDLHAVYPVAVDLNAAGEPEVPNQPMVTALMLDLIQKQAKRIDTLDSRVAAVEAS